MISDLKSQLKHGVVPAMATPLHADATIRIQALERLIAFLIDAGVNGLFVGGTTGEGILLDRNQRKLLHESSVKIVSGEVPVLLHVGANTTSESIDLARHAAALGADAAVAVTPYYYPMHDEGLLAYYSEVAAEVQPLPFLAYDIPQMAVNGIGPKLVRKMAGAIENFAGLKTSRPDAQGVRALVDAASGRLLVLAGNERIALGSLALGAEGLISGLCTAIPEPFVAMTKAFADGDLAKAQKHQRTINRLIDLLPEGARIGAIKKLLTDRGIDVGLSVPPRPMPDNGWTGWTEMSAVLEESQSLL